MGPTTMTEERRYRDREIRDILDLAAREERPHDALGELDARVRVLEERPRRDHVGLDQRLAVGAQAQLLQALAHDLADALGVVAVAVPDDDARGLRGVHADHVSASLRLWIESLSTLTGTGHTS